MSHLVYPFWYPLDGSPARALALFSLLAATALLLRHVFRRALGDSTCDPFLKELLRLPRDPVLWGLLALSAAIRLYPMRLPAHLWGAGDEAVHMGFPALPFKAWQRLTGAPFFPLFWLAAWGAWALRRRLRLPRGPWPTLAAAAVWFGLVFALIRRLAASGYPTLPADILRSPPLSKAAHMAAYAAFGVSNFTGRLPELLFYLAGAVLIYKLARTRSKATARFAAMLYLLLPPFAYYAMRGSQTHGELFFYLLTAFCFASWLKNGAERTLYWTMLAAVAGALYRYSALPLAGLAAAAALAAHLKEPKRLPVSSTTARECGVMLAAGTIPWASSYLLYGLRPYAAGGRQSFWEGLLEPALSLPAGLSYPVAALLACAFLAALARPKDALGKYMLGWFALYYLFISRDLGWDVRLTLPMYPPLIFWTAELLARSGRLAPALGAALSAYLLWIGLWAPAGALAPEFTFRRSLRTEYSPLGAAARTIEALPEGSSVLAVDCSRGCFSFYLPNPGRLRWTNVESAKLGSLDELAALCGEKGIGTVVYVAGTVEGMGERKNPELFQEFAADDPRFDWRADHRLGLNRIAIKDFRPD